MSVDNHWYSLINNKNHFKSDDQYSLVSFYNVLTHPTGILATIVFFFVLLHQEILIDIKNFIGGDNAAYMNILLFFFTMVLGVRLVHSIFLAKRDYKNLKIGFLDIIIFLFVILFATGGVLNLVRYFIGSGAEYHRFIITLYAAAGFLGTINFFMLWVSRIPKDSEMFDYSIEKHIQRINTFIFSYLTLIFILMIYLIGNEPIDKYLFSIIFGSGAILLILNIIHSEQLTYKPKYLLTNKNDTIEALINEFKTKFSHIVGTKKSSAIRDLITNGRYVKENFIKTARATPKDVEFISSQLLHHFGYVFKYITGIEDGEVLEKILNKIILSTHGFGKLGYMNFYFVINDHGERVGFFKVDDHYGNWLYTVANTIALSYILTRNLGLSEYFGLLYRARKIQRNPNRNEISLTYLVIYSEHQRNGFGSALIRLLLNAYINNKTDDINAEKLTLLVRQNNFAAQNLFRKAGFKTKTSEDIQTLADPFLSDPDIGKPITLTYTCFESS